MTSELEAQDDEAITRAMVRAGVGHLTAPGIRVCRMLIQEARERGSRELESALAYLEHMAGQWKSGSSAKGHHLPLKHVYRWIADIRVGDAGTQAQARERTLDDFKKMEGLVALANERVDTFEKISDRLRDKVAEEQAEVRRRDELLREIQKKYLHEPDTDFMHDPEDTRLVREMARDHRLDENALVALTGYLNKLRG